MGVVKRKYRLRVNSIDKIEELLQEIYDEADKTIVEVQNQLNKLTSSNVAPALPKPVEVLI